MKARLNLKMRAKKRLTFRLKGLLNKFIRKDFPYIKIEKIKVDFYYDKDILNKLSELQEEMKERITKNGI